MLVFTRVLVICAIAFQPMIGAAVPAEGHRIMYAGPSPYGVEIVRDIQRKGGNVVDATIAAVLSITVTNPYFGALGGGGFAVVKMGKDVKALDFREMAPAKAHEKLYEDKPEKASIEGGLAVGVPGMAMGLYELHKKHGKLKWNQLFDGAIRLADQGFPLSGEWVKVTGWGRSRNHLSPELMKLVSDPKGEALKPGAILKQPKLAKLLKLMRDKGASAFYSGDVAKDIVSTVNSTGGIFDVKDLANYKARWLAPLTAQYSGHTLHLMPPPSSGGIVIAQAVQLLDKLNINAHEPLSVNELHLLIEAMKLSFKGRPELGDPAFVENPVERLLSPESIAKLASLVKMDKAIDVEKIKAQPEESQNTTHLSVMDADGNAVAMTVTLNGDWGSGLMTPKYGIALNNEMDDFNTRQGKPNMFGLIQGKANNVRPGARPLSSMSPTIVEKDGRTVLVVGAPGGPRIITAVLQVIYRTLRGPFDIDQAVQAPRVHHQFLPNIVRMDKLKLPPETIEALTKKGHKIEFSSTGKAYGIVRDENGILMGAADARGEAGAGGL